MSTKTIAVNLEVYRRLAGIKAEGESFSRAIDRLLDRHLKAHTGADILANLSDAPPALTDREAQQMVGIVKQSRQSESWDLLAVP